MILERIFNMALPRLEGKKIKDIRIGLGLMAVELDDGLIGVTYVLRNEVQHTCMIFSQDGNIIGMNAGDVAKWALEGKNVILKAAGLAVLNSVADFDNFKHQNENHDADAVFSVEIKPDDTIGIIGHIGPVISRLENKAKNIYIFERDEDKANHILPESEQPKLLPQCHVVFITSSTIINGTCEKILSYCKNARDVVMVGSSTPMYPEAFKESAVSVLSGTRWLSSNKDEILKGVSQCAGIKQLIKFGEKLSVRVDV